MHPTLNKRIQLELRISRLEVAFCLAVDNYFFSIRSRKRAAAVAAVAAIRHLIIMLDLLLNRIELLN